LDSFYYQWKTFTACDIIHFGKECVLHMLYALLISIIIAFLIHKAYKNTQDIKINHIQIPSKEETDPEESLSILHLSDLHLENISVTPEQLAKKLGNKPIDLIALTGDFLDRKRSISKLIPYLNVLNHLNAKYGMYAVLGNHDYVLKDDDLQYLQQVLTEHHCHVLQNSNDIISVNGKTVNIIGVDDHSTDRSNLALAYQQIEEGMNIVLTHDPNIVLEMEDFPFDYLMAGHFHGGQICYPRAY